ncbi:MAG: lipoyl(octanoyl) transferase LipB [Cyanobacteria bacterium P01_D01_bin.36]
MNTANLGKYPSNSSGDQLARERGQKGVVYLLDEVSYSVAWRWQKQLVEARKLAVEATASGLSDVLLLLQHPPVYTLGQGADTKFVRFDLDNDAYEIHRIERGGEVTYHCPGQLVGYPILNLRRHRMDLHWYLRQLEEVLIRTLACYGLSAERIPGLTGVWLEGRKVAAIGIKVSRWITMHGFALNICPDLTGFEKIVPCGIAEREVGSMAQVLPNVEFELVRQRVIEQFEQVFEMKLVVASSVEIAELVAG